MLVSLYIKRGIYFFLDMAFCFLGVGVFFFISSNVIIVEWLIMIMNTGTVSYTIILDWMSMMFIGVVCFISCSLVFYSQYYMISDFYLNRFIILVGGFVFSMFLLIVSPNLMGILLGWDGLGLISYCLVIYFQNAKSQSAGMTILINKLEDGF